MEKPKNFYVRPMDMNEDEGMLVEGGVQGGGELNGEKMGQL